MLRIPRHLQPSRIAIVSVVVGALSLATGLLAHAQTPAAAQVRPEAKHGANGSLDVVIRADGVRDLGGFQLVLSWDSTLVKFVSVENGTLLGSSGRRPYCPEPVVDTAAVRLACVTFDPSAAAATSANHTPVPGAKGSGELAVAHFRMLKSGTAPFNLSHVILVDPTGANLSSQSSNLTYSLDQSSSRFSVAMIAIIVGGAVAAIVIVGVALFVFRRRTTSARALPAASTAAEGHEPPHP